MRVYLDDVRETPNGWTRAYTAQEAIEFLKTGTVDEIDLDHDLGVEAEVGTGYDVLLWLEKQVREGAMVPPRIMRTHTANSAAEERMHQAIEAIQRSIDAGEEEA